MEKIKIPLQDFDGYYEEMKAFTELPDDEAERMLEDYLVSN